MLEVDAAGTLPEDELAILEDNLGMALPAAYRRWLATTNGGKASGDPPLPGIPDEEGDVLVDLLGARDDEPANDLRWYRHTQLHHDEGCIADVPAEFLHVGATGNGAVLVKVTGDDVGSVWWADCDLLSDAVERDLDVANHALRRLADDFDAFLALF